MAERPARRGTGGRAAAAVLGSAAALAGVAALVNWQARAAERRHPPIGDFITVDGVRLHYVDVGDGPPIVLLHGNSSMLQDFVLSILEPLARNHRVIAFDRPGFGYSDRPKDVVWTPEAQAALLRDALAVLGVERPVIFGHSWAACVALCFALDYPDEISGVVVESGYYYPHRRPDAAISAINSKPVIGWIGRNTISPVMGAIFGKAMVKGMFSPNPIPPTYAEFPAKLALRPWHLRAGAEEAATMRGWARRTWRDYPAIDVPVMILAGTKDRLAGYHNHAVRLHHDILSSRLRLWPGTGHMLHHIHPGGVIDAIEEVWEMAEQRAAVDEAPGRGARARLRRATRCGTSLWLTRRQRTATQRAYPREPLTRSWLSGTRLLSRPCRSSACTSCPNRRGRGRCGRPWAFPGGRGSAR